MITVRAWGFEDLVAPWGKRVVYSSQGRGPLHSHDKDEVVLIVEGLAWIEMGQVPGALSGFWAEENCRVGIPPGTLHRVTALRPTSTIEFSPSAIGEDKEAVAGGRVGEDEFRALLSDFYRYENRNVIVGVEEAGIIAQAMHKEGRIVGMCNGCFDLTHLGHMELLQQARQRCEVLFVAVNSDKSVAALKPGRPFVGQKGRTGMVASTRYADYVVLAENKTCVDILRAIKPSVYVTTAENGVNGIEAKEAIGMGTPVQVVEMVPGFNTTKIAQAVAAKMGRAGA